MTLRMSWTSSSSSGLMREVEVDCPCCPGCSCCSCCSWYFILTFYEVFSFLSSPIYVSTTYLTEEFGGRFSVVFKSCRSRTNPGSPNFLMGTCLSEKLVRSRRHRFFVSSAVYGTIPISCSLLGPSTGRHRARNSLYSNYVHSIAKHFHLSCIYIS